MFDGFDVAVHDAGLVRGVQRLADLHADLDHVGDGSGPRWRRIRA